MASEHIARLNIPLNVQIASLSGGQQAQVALTLCLAKQPELLLLDEPAAELDPVAREELLRFLMEQVSDTGSSVILSTHSLNDVSTICDYVIVLAHSRVVLANDIDFVMETHRFLTASLEDNPPVPGGVVKLKEELSKRERTIMARLELPVFDRRWTVEQPTLEEIVMAYLRIGTSSDNLPHSLEAFDDGAQQ